MLVIIAKLIQQLAMETKRENNIELSTKYYFNDIFMEEIGINNHKLFKLLQKTNISHDLFYFSHYRRLAVNNNILKHAFVTTKTSMLTVCLKVKWKNYSCNYGFLYFSPSTEPSSKKYVPAYISLAPAFSSQDGEYRGRYITYDQFCKLFIDYAQMTEPIEESVLRDMGGGDLELSSEFCIPNIMTDRSSDESVEYVDSSRVLVKAYVICWLMDYYNIYNHIEENHINEAYKKIFAQPNDRPLFEKIYAESADIYPLFLKSATMYDSTLPDIQGVNRVVARASCGQKIFPITFTETVKTDDINYNIWREIYIGNLCGNLVLNHITPSYPMVVNWYYIQQSRATIFDNRAMHVKYEYSEIATEITDELMAIDLMNYKERNRDFGPISSDFKELSNNIHHTLELANSDIKLSDISICLLTEYVGKTLQDSARLINGTYKDQSVMQIYTDPRLFAKMYFEFIYGLYCANSKVMVIHGDLHMNNATIYKFCDLPNLKTKVIGDPKCMFIVRDDTYIFPHNGCHGVIIDFSRSILGDRKTIAHSYSKNFMEMFISDQNGRFLSTIMSHLPEFYKKYAVEIMNMLIYDFDTIFKLMTLLDSHVITNNILFLLKAKDFSNVNVHPDCFSLLERAQKKINYLLNSIMQNVLNKNELKFEWPNYTLLRDLFSDNIYNPERIKKEIDTMSILDVYNENNALKYDGEDIDSWGPLLTTPYYQGLLAKNDPSSPDALLYKRFTKILAIDETAELQKLHMQYLKYDKVV